MNNKKISVVIPCYKVKNKILDVVEKVPLYVDKIFIIDDCCPEHTGDFVNKNCTDKRVSVIYHEKNLGVGGAVISGYKAAIKDDYDIIVKIDGDDQMEPSLISKFIYPLIKGQADYTKGNRFWNIEDVRNMPKIRVFGNAVLSFMNKMSSGYWHVFDPTNGYTAITSTVAAQLPFDKISKRYFFESDILFRLNVLRAVVVDVPMVAKYADEVSNLSIRKILFEFLAKHCANAIKRIFYSYFLRDFSIASIQLIFSIILISFGLIFGLSNWDDETLASSGTVMLAAMPTFLGIVFMMAFVNYDILSEPKKPLSESLENIKYFEDRLQEE